MTTSIEGPVVRRELKPTSLAHITTAPILRIEPGRGVLFDGALSAAEVDAAWWFVTSRDDDDQAKREAIAGLRAAAAGPAATDADVKALALALADYLLGT